MNWTLIIAGAVAVTGLVDYGLTRWGIELGLRETNPFLRRMIGLRAAWWHVGKLGLTGAGAAGVVWVADPGLNVIAAGLIVAYLLVIRNNVRRIRDKLRE